MQDVLDRLAGTMRAVAQTFDRTLAPLAGWKDRWAEWEWDSDQYAAALDAAARLRSYKEEG